MKKNNFKVLLMLFFMVSNSLIPLYATPEIDNAEATSLNSIEVKKHPNADFLSIVFSLKGRNPAHIPLLSKKETSFKILFSQLQIKLDKQFYIDNLANISLSQTGKLSELQISLSPKVSIYDAIQQKVTNEGYELILNVIKSKAGLGTFEQPIIDSNMTEDEAMDNVESLNVPHYILRRQKLISVKYYSFDNKIHQGQLIMDERLTNDVIDIFKLALQEKFLIHSVIPITTFNWDDDKSMAENNTSGFNYRKVEGKKTLSKHSYGQALDINPLYNPYIRNNKISPPKAVYDKNQVGTLTATSKLVKAFIKKGWTWGGNWKTMKDYQHFQKRLK
ncbi:MAG: hypothetical protein GQ569_14355 [Methylococcaceae bacterium]|nr:hypothetical protein [Methylococcaceae bacterium]